MVQLEYRARHSVEKIIIFFHIMIEEAATLVKSNTPLADMD